LRCPPLWVRSSPPGGLRSCGKPREDHRSAARGSKWFLCGAQPLQNLFLCVAAGGCWCFSNFKLTCQQLGCTQKRRTHQLLRAQLTNRSQWEFMVGPRMIIFSIKRTVYHVVFSRAKQNWVLMTAASGLKTGPAYPVTCLIFLGLSVALIKDFSLPTNFQSLKLEQKSC